MKITIEIPDQTIDDVRSSCNIAYWAQVKHEGDSVYIRDVAGDGDWIDLTDRRIMQALECMAKVAPRQLGRVLDGSFDAGTGDTLIQLALFGKLVYA